jgi:hypothetical protein
MKSNGREASLILPPFALAEPIRDGLYCGMGKKLWCPTTMLVHVRIEMGGGV